MPQIPRNPLQPSVLADMQTVYAEIMPDQATNARTGLTTAAFVNDQPKLLMIERMLRFRSYQIDVPVATDCVAGDQITLAGSAEAFAVEQTLTPVSYPLCLQLICVPVRLPLASYLAIETGVFQHRTDLTKTVTASVYVRDNLEDAQTYGTTPAYPWTIVFENTLAYAGGGKVGANHRLLLASVFGTDASGHARAGVISKPRPILHGLPFMVAFAKELGG